ncbi:hypothetical protein ANCDUO_25436, partial [Ancylostoma duodenale]
YVQQMQANPEHYLDKDLRQFVETIGDGYLCVSGLPKRNGLEHIKAICDLSLELLSGLRLEREASRQQLELIYYYESEPEFTTMNP